MFQLQKSHYVSDHTWLNKFLKLIKQGPCCFCFSSNICFCKSNVKVLKKNEIFFKFLSITNTEGKSFDGKAYVCKTCYLQVFKSQVPCQAVINKLYLDKVPEVTKILIH